MVEISGIVAVVVISGTDGVVVVSGEFSLVVFSGTYAVVFMSDTCVGVVSLGTLDVGTSVILIVIFCADTSDVVVFCVTVAVPFVSVLCFTIVVCGKYFIAVVSGNSVVIVVCEMSVVVCVVGTDNVATFDVLAVEAEVCFFVIAEEAVMISGMVLGIGSFVSGSEVEGVLIITAVFVKSFFVSVVYRVSKLDGLVFAEPSTCCCVGGDKVSDFLAVARLGFSVGISVATIAGRPVGVNADTGIGAFVPSVP